MNNFFISLLIGVTAGTIDILPMVIGGRADRNTFLSVFIHWVVLGFIIPYVTWPMQPWLKGLLIAELSSLPMIITMLQKEPRSVVGIIIFSAVLGSIIGIAGAKFIRIV